MISLLRSKHIPEQQWFSRANAFLVRMLRLSLYLADTDNVTQRLRRIWIPGEESLAMNKSTRVSPAYWTMLLSAGSHLGMTLQVYSYPLACA